MCVQRHDLKPVSKFVCYFRYRSARPLLALPGSGVTRGGPGGDTLQGVTPEGKKFCGQIYKEKWRNEVKKGVGDTLQGGDTRVKSLKSDKVTVMSKKGHQFFRRK